MTGKNGTGTILLSPRALSEAPEVIKKAADPIINKKGFVSKSR